MNLKEILKAVNENTLAVAKALQEWNTDEAVDLLTKHSETITQRIEKSSEEDSSQNTTPEEWSTDDIETQQEETPPSEPPANDPAPTEPVEKNTQHSLTKQQHDLLSKAMDLWDEWRAVLKKFVEMYISASDVPDFISQFDEIKDRLSKLETTSQQLPEWTPIKKSSLEWVLSVK